MHGQTHTHTAVKAAAAAAAATGASARVRLLDASLLPNGCRRQEPHLPHGAFTYSDDLQSWLCMGDEAFTLSEHRSSLPPPLPPNAANSSLPPSLPLIARRLQPATGPPSLSALQAGHGLTSGRYEQNPARLAASMAAAPTEHQRLVSLGHLEHQLAASKALGNQDVYKEWLRTYANALGEQVAMRPQLTGAVHELCDQCSGRSTLTRRPRRRRESGRQR